jgi:hypothetical protein
MPNCPGCDTEMDNEEFEGYEKGDIFTCPECNAELEITDTNPIELSVLDLDDEDDEYEDDETDDEDDYDGDEDYEEDYDSDYDEDYDDDDYYDDDDKDWK